MYLFGRVLRLRVLAALFGAVVYMFSGFLIVSVVFTMFLAAVPWLPLLLAVIEFIVQSRRRRACAASARSLRGGRRGRHRAGRAGGAPGVDLLHAADRGCVQPGAPAGRPRAHPADAAPAGSAAHLLTRILKLAGWLLTMAVLGVALGAVQLLPLVELLPLNFREGSASLAQVREWAWPSRHVLTFALPNIFGNPSHHQWFDIWARAWIPATLNALGEPRPHDLLGHQELRRGRRLSRSGDVVAGGGGGGGGGAGRMEKEIGE
jgi:hypothetical protein